MRSSRQPTPHPPAGATAGFFSGLLRVLDNENELATFERCFGFRPSLDLGEKVNTHDQHVPADPEAMAAARVAFRASCDAVNERFRARVPPSWGMDHDAVV